MKRVPKLIYKTFKAKRWENNSFSVRIFYLFGMRVVVVI